MTPKQVIVGSAEWLEYRIPGFKFQGLGWYHDGLILVLDFSVESYQAFLYESDPRPSFTAALNLPTYNP